MVSVPVNGSVSVPLKSVVVSRTSWIFSLNEPPAKLNSCGLKSIYTNPPMAVMKPVTKAEGLTVVEIGEPKVTSNFNVSPRKAYGLNGPVLRSEKPPKAISVATFGAGSEKVALSKPVNLRLWLVDVGAGEQDDPKHPTVSYCTVDACAAVEPMMSAKAAAFKSEINFI